MATTATMLPAETPAADAPHAGLQTGLALNCTPAEVVAALRGIHQLEGLTTEEYTWLATHGTMLRFADADIVFRSGDMVDSMSILLEGEIHVRRHQSGPISYFIGRSGQLTGKLPYSRMKFYGGEGYASGEVWLLNLSESRFPQMLAAIPSMGQRCVSVLLDRVREVTRIEQQSEKLTALGKLAANLSHELNNPASAARSAANNLWTELRTYGDNKFRLGSMCLSPEMKQNYGEWMTSIRDLIGPDDHPIRADVATISDREEQIDRWMTARAIPEPWRITPTLAETRIQISHLDALAEAVSPEALPVALASMTSALNAERMTDAVIDSTRRIFELISAIKDYSYMDQAPIQEVNLPQAIENTLTMFTSRLANVNVSRAFADDTPEILAYGSELNQVWTAIIENALDAMDTLPASDPRCLRVHTALSGPAVLIEIWDNGPGIAPEIMSRLFEPFFTTKAVGSGLGLGLDVANRIVTKHRGQITVDSAPGRTCFQVRLPVEQAGAY